MRAIIALVVIVLLMGLAGWITLGHSPDKTSINLETEEIERDTKNAVENAEDLLESGTRAITDDHGHNSDPNDTGRVSPVDVDKEPVTTAPVAAPSDSPSSTP
jgi:hypothetical protein